MSIERAEVIIHPDEPERGCAYIDGRCESEAQAMEPF